MINALRYYIRGLDLWPKLIALEVQNRQYSYMELWENASFLSGILYKAKEQTNSTVVGIFAHRSLLVYSGILATLKNGMAYLPFNPRFPVERIAKMLHISKCKILLISSEFNYLIPKIFDHIGKGTIIVIPDTESINFSEFKTFTLKDAEKSGVDYSITEVNGSTPAYILFTSGTTGEPKGIPVSHENLNTYLDNILPKYKISPQDRCSQAFDTTFDPSLHDMFLAWSNGAALICVPEKDLISPHRFILEKKITIWSSIPSLVVFMKRFNVLKEGIFPLIKYTLFTGEALPFEVYLNWRKAAPNSVIINGYGPTEATINISDFEIPEELTLADCRNSVVPIGHIFPGHDYRLIPVDDSIPPRFELTIAGPQIVKEYLNNPEKTEKNFIYINGKKYYRTGDLVEYSGNRGLLFAGRIDDQVKIRGYRIELQEIESIIKKITRSDGVVAIAWPANRNPAEEIICFILGKKLEEDSKIFNQINQLLPDYMIPKKLIYISEFPYNLNGKIDKTRLYKKLEDL